MPRPRRKGNKLPLPDPDNCKQVSFFSTAINTWLSKSIAKRTTATYPTSSVKLPRRFSIAQEVSPMSKGLEDILAEIEALTDETDNDKPIASLATDQSAPGQGDRPAIMMTTEGMRREMEAFELDQPVNENLPPDYNCEPGQIVVPDPERHDVARGYWRRNEEGSFTWEGEEPPPPYQHAYTDDPRMTEEELAADPRPNEPWMRLPRDVPAGNYFWIPVAPTRNRRQAVLRNIDPTSQSHADRIRRRELYIQRQQALQRELSTIPNHHLTIDEALAQIEQAVIENPELITPHMVAELNHSVRDCGAAGVHPGILAETLLTMVSHNHRRTQIATEPQVAAFWTTYNRIRTLRG